jgi:hypothetical protein
VAAPNIGTAAGAVHSYTDDGQHGSGHDQRGSFGRISKWLNSNPLMDKFLSEAEEHKSGMARQRAPLLNKQHPSKPVPERAKTSSNRCHADH